MSKEASLLQAVRNSGMYMKKCTCYSQKVLVSDIRFDERKQNWRGFHIINLHEDIAIVHWCFSAINPRALIRLSFSAASIAFEGLSLRSLLTWFPNVRSKTLVTLTFIDLIGNAAAIPDVSLPPIPTPALAPAPPLPPPSKPDERERKGELEQRRRVEEQWIRAQEQHPEVYCTIIR